MRKIKNTWIFHKKDTWDLDTILAPIILAGLKKFKYELVSRHAENKVISVPVTVMADIEELTEADIQRWFEILEYMIYAFDVSNKPNVEYYTIETGAGWDQYRKAMKAYETKKLRGMKLFAEYFNDLWW